MGQINQKGARMVKDGEHLHGLIANYQLIKFRLNFSRCTNRDVAPLRINLGNLEKCPTPGQPLSFSLHVHKLLGYCWHCLW